MARLARSLVDRLRMMTLEINQIDDEIAELVEELAPALIAIVGCGTLTAAKIHGETAGVARFKSKDAYARHNGTARCRCGRPTRPDTGSAEPETVN